MQREQFLPAAKPRAKAQSQESIGPGVKINTHAHTQTRLLSLSLKQDTDRQILFSQKSEDGATVSSMQEYF